MPTYAALLRGINVGGKNVIRMADLRASLEGLGLQHVATYIQSGNVVFSSPERSESRLTARIAARLSEDFAYDATLAVKTRAQMARAVEAAPAGFGSEPEVYRYDVLFLLPPYTPERALEEIATRDGVDAVWPGSGVVYFRRLIARASQSRLSRISLQPVYAHVTVRNWNTTRKLRGMMAR